MECPVGSYCEAGVAGPTACPPGFFNPNTGRVYYHGVLLFVSSHGFFSLN